jgi:hypothetical protein
MPQEQGGTVQSQGYVMTEGQSISMYWYRVHAALEELYWNEFYFHIRKVTLELNL